MSSTAFHCPVCERPFEADHAWQGLTVTCPLCGADVTLPGATTAPGGEHYDAPLPPPPPAWDVPPPLPPDVPSAAPTIDDYVAPPPPPPLDSDALQAQFVPPFDATPAAAHWEVAAMSPPPAPPSIQADPVVESALRQAELPTNPAAEADAPIAMPLRPLSVAERQAKVTPNSVAREMDQPVPKAPIKLAPGEKSRRRKRRSLATMIFCALVLLVTMLMISRFKS